MKWNDFAKIVAVIGMCILVIPFIIACAIELKGTPNSYVLLASALGLFVSTSYFAFLKN